MYLILPTIGTQIFADMLIGVMNHILNLGTYLLLVSCIYFHMDIKNQQIMTFYLCSYICTCLYVRTHRAEKEQAGKYLFI